MKVLVDCDDYSTVKVELGKLLETDVVKRDSQMDQISSEFEQVIGRRVVNDGLESAIISDLFFNCEAVDSLTFSEGEYLELEEAARLFNKELFSPFKEKYPIEWLVNDFLSRV